jgi:hypothetical protein
VIVAIGTAPKAIRFDIVMREYYRLFLAVLFFSCLTSCDRQQAEEPFAPGGKARKEVSEVEPIAEDRVVAGQTIYVPVYSSVYTSDKAHRINLAASLSIRNTDRQHAIVIGAARYYGEDGQLVREYAKKPLRVGPMASLDFFVSESDTSGGVSASFLVEWVAEQSVTAPVVESVMIGTASTLGISFTSPGRVLTDRSRPRSGNSEGR